MRTALQLSEPIVFLRSLLQDPRSMGALLPSSPQLSHLMASHVDPASSAVLEIGAGTGPVTQALLKKGIGPDRLLVIERDPALVCHLQKRFPDVRVRCDDAVHACRVLWDEDIHQVETVVSSLPLRNLRPQEKMETVRAILKAIAPGGQLIQFTYALGCPIQSRRLNLHAECLGRVWRNLPPAAVWRFTRRPAN